MLFDKNKANLPRVCIKTLQIKPTKLTLTVNDVLGANQTKQNPCSGARSPTQAHEAVSGSANSSWASADLIMSGVLNACLRAWE